MAILTVAVSQLPGGNFSGAGNDTLELTGSAYELADLTAASFSGFATITTASTLRVRVSSEQLASVSTIQVSGNGSLEIVGPSVDLRGKTLYAPFGVDLSDGAHIYADDSVILGRIESYNTHDETLHYLSALSEAKRAELHLLGFDTIVDDTGTTTTNPAPLILNLASELPTLQPGEQILLAGSGNATISDDQGTIRTLHIETTNISDSILILNDSRLKVERYDNDFYDLYFDNIKIGGYLREGFGDIVSYRFFDNASEEAVNYILQHLKFGKALYSDGEHNIVLTTTDKGGRISERIIKVPGPNGVWSPDHVPTPPVLSNNSVAESSAPETVIGLLSANDPKGHSLSYSLADNHGGLFRIDGNRLILDGKLDFEQQSSYVLTFSASDGYGGSNYNTITLKIADVINEISSGTPVAERILGGIGNDRLSGHGGNDTLGGGVGIDILAGGAGKDIFVFNTKPNRKTNLDKIMDFNVKDDTLWLDNAVFKKLGKKGSELQPAKLNKAFFTIGSKAKDKNDYLIYDNKKGVLSYDADGSGEKAAVEIALLKKGLKLTTADFLVI